MIPLYQFILEGGAAGHMHHPYDYSEFTLRDLKGLIRNLFSGKIEDVTEKIDGTNIVATMNMDGEVVFIRNNGDLNSPKGGMSILDMATKWADKPSVAKTFLSAGDTLTKVLGKIGKEFFNPDPETRIAANCECVIAGKTNIMPYASSQVDIHDLFVYKKNGDKWDQVETTKKGLDKLQKACEDVDGAQITPQVLIKTTEESAKVMVDFIKELDKIWKSVSLNEYSTIDEWKRARFNDIVLGDYDWIASSMEGMEILYKRWFNADKSTNIREIKKIYPDNSNDITALDGKEAKKLVDRAMEPLDTFFGKFGNAVIKQCDGILNAGLESTTIEQLKKDIEEVTDDVRKNGSTELNDKLTHQLDRLARLGNEINPVEGIVFRYKGRLMKVVGSFASANQILGTIKFSKK